MPNINDTLDSYSVAGSAKGLEVSSKFVVDSKNPDNYKLENQGSNSIGEYFVYKDVEYKRPSGIATYDIKITISNVSEYSSGTVNTEIKVSPDFWVYVEGYRNVEFKLEVLDAKTKKPINSDVAFFMTDIDADQVMSVYNIKKNNLIISDKSILQSRNNKGNIEFTSTGDTSLYEETGVIAESNSNLSFNFSINKGLDSFNKYNYGGAFKLDLRIPYYYGDIDLNKVDENGVALKGAEFTIYDSSGKEIQKLITDENGYAKSVKLPFGIYNIKETKAPIGYELNNNIFSVEIDQVNERCHVNNGKGIVNKKKEEVKKPITPDKPVNPEKPTDSGNSNNNSESSIKKKKLIQTGKNSKLIIIVTIVIMLLLMGKNKKTKNQP